MFIFINNAKRKTASADRSGFSLIVSQLVICGSTDGAGCCASAALYAHLGIDLVLAVALSDSTDGAICCASAAGNEIGRAHV